MNEWTELSSVMGALQAALALHREEFGSAVSKALSFLRAREAGKGGGSPSSHSARSRVGNRKLRKFQDTRESARAPMHSMRQSARAHTYDEWEEGGRVGRSDNHRIYMPRGCVRRVRIAREESTYCEIRRRFVPMLLLRSIRTREGTILLARYLPNKIRAASVR